MGGMVNIKYKIYEEDHMLRPANPITGPYYDTTVWFKDWGYDTIEDAEKALEHYFDSDRYGKFIIMKVYLP